MKLNFHRLFVGGLLLVSADVSRLHAFQPFIGLSGGATSISGAQNQFGWDFNAKLGLWMPYLDLGLSAGGSGVTTKTDPITGRALSGVTTAGGSFREVQREVTYSIYLFTFEGFATIKFPIYGQLSVTGTFVLGYLLDINTRGSFLDALGTVDTPDEATLIEMRQTVLFQGYSLTGLLGIEFNLTAFTVFLDAGYRYSEPEITTIVPGEEKNQTLSKTFKQDVSGLVIRAGVKLLLGGI